MPIYNFYPSINHILLYHSTWNLTKKIRNLAENVSAWDRHEVIFDFQLTMECSKLPSRIVRFIVNPLIVITSLEWLRR